MSDPNSVNAVELVSIGANGVTIDELLTETISPKLRWLKQGVGIGDAGLGPAKPLLATFEKQGLTDFFEYVELQPIEADGLENLHLIGGDGDGHEYVVGLKSEQFYVMWHDPTEFELVGQTEREFIQWVIRMRSDHLEGCPWEVFTTGATKTHGHWIWHRDQVDPAPILDKAKEILDWSREYASSHGFELLNQDREMDLRFKAQHRGKNSHIQIIAAQDVPEIQLILQWLEERGFGRT